MVQAGSASRSNNTRKGPPHITSTAPAFSRRAESAGEGEDCRVTDTPAWS